MLYLDPRPNCAERGLSSMISTVFASEILVLPSSGASHVKKNLTYANNKYLGRVQSSNPRPSGWELRQLYQSCQAGDDLPRFRTLTTGAACYKWGGCLKFLCTKKLRWNSAARLDPWETFINSSLLIFLYIFFFFSYLYFSFL